MLQLWRHANLTLIPSSCLSKPSWVNNRLCFCLLFFKYFLSFLLSLFFFFLRRYLTSSSFCSAPSDPETSMSSLGIMSFRRSLIPLYGRSICGFECSSYSLLFFLDSSISCCLFSLASSVFFRLSSAFISSSLRFWAAWSASSFSFFRLDYRVNRVEKIGLAWFDKG